MTEDIEATWHLLDKGYQIKMSFVAKSATEAPDTIGKWFRQRVRWNIGGYQCIIKYKNSWFKKGMLGYFIIPFFAISLILGVVGLGILFYRTIRGILTYYLSTLYSIEAQTAILSLSDINVNPSILNFIGMVVFIIGMGFIFFALRYINKHIHEKENFFIVVFYSLVYILLRPIVLLLSLGKFFTGKYSWR
jgi:poly-beta-1,6-N-acetyl-D-glucosamine synthase